MKFVISAPILRDAMAKLITVVDRKNSRPILTNCLIKASGTELELIATDLEVSAKIILKAQISEGGNLCINTKNIFDILRELPNDDVSLSVDSGNQLKLICRNIDYQLMVTSADEFPQLAFSNSGSEFKIQSKQVLQIIDKTSHAISTDETRLYLNGIYLQQFDNKLRAVAIDGHRLALLDTAEFIGQNKQLLDGVIIPRKGISELKKIAENYSDKDLTISLDESFMFVQANNDYFLSVRLIARDYPKYQTVIPSKTSFNFIIEKNTVIDAVKRIRILSNEKTNGIKFSISENQLVISTKHPAMGEAIEILPISYTGKNIDIGFNAKYLLDSLSVMNEGSDITFEFNNELSPVVIKSAELPHYLGIIMPLKI
jgi:DNA polymerase III subunit beta